MLKPFHWQPQRAIVALTAMVGLILVALVAYDLHREYRLAVENAGAQTRGLSQLLQEHARQSMRRVELALAQASGELKDLRTDDRQSQEQVRQRLITHLPTDLLIGSFGVIDKAGQIVVSTPTDRPYLLPGASDRDYFLAHVNGSTSGIFVGAAVKSRVTDKWIIPVSVRRVSARGEFDGVFMAALDPAYFQSFYNSIEVGSDGFVTLFSREGWAVARSPFDESIAEKNWAASPLFLNHLAKASSGTIRQVVVADGVERIYSYSSVRDYPLIVAVGISLTDGLAAWRDRMAIELALLGLLLLVLGLAGFMLSRQWRERIRVQSAYELSQISIQTASLATFWIAKDARILRVNQAACDLHGYSREQLLNMRITDLDPDFPAERWPEHWQELREKKHMVFETTHKTRAGDFMPVEVELNHIEFEGEEYNFAFSRDISQRLKAEEEIRRGERMLREAIDAVDEAFVLFDPQDRLVYCNEKYRCLYPGMEHLMVPGTRFEELVRQGATLGLYKESQGNEEDWIQKRLLAHQEGRTVRVQKRGDGQVLRVIDRKTADGHTVGFRVDITEVVRATEAAQEASRYKSQFLANMSHEIRTPMNAILGLLKLMQSTPLNAQQKDYAIKTDTAAKSLLGLLNDILDFSKVEAGKMVLDPHPFRLDRMLRDVSVVLSSTIGAKPIEVVYDIDPVVPAVLMGDAMRLRQVLINLAGNAIKFTERGQVIVRVRSVGEVDFGDAVEARIEFSVEDTGIGIDARDRDRVFDGFSQAEASTTRRFGGTGLGLAICKRLLELMGGELTVQSMLGEGSTFLFTLQLAVVAQPGRELAEHRHEQVPNWRVLVVDDNPIANAATSAMARSWGWQVDCAADAASALHTLGARLKVSRGDQGPPYDLLLVDWQMPEVDGWETTRALLAACANAGQVAPRVIMLTATGRDTVAQRTPQEQAIIHGFLFKPFTAGMLLDAAIGPHVEISRPAGFPGSTRQQRLEGLRILVVEDNVINQQVAQELLSLEGALVSIAANGLLGVEAVTNASPAFDAVLMDIQMPVLDGYGATGEIRKLWSLHDLPIIAMTANAMASDRAACLAAGMNDHIGKPFDMNHLVHVLLRCVGHATHGLDVAPTSLNTATDDADLPLLDVDHALQRLSGLESVYLRIAQEFMTLLEIAPHEFRALAQDGALQPLALQMHTLKGLAGTIGAMALSAHAARLDRLCREAPAGFTAMDHAASFESLVVSTTEAIELAIERISLGLVDVEQQPDDAVVAPDEDSWQQLRLALGEIRKLTVASDLSVLGRFDELRSALRVMPRDQYRALESAISRLDLARASEICIAALSSRQDAEC